MILRRQYIKGRPYKYKFRPDINTFHELCELSMEDDSVFDKDNATYFWDKLTKLEQKMFWENTLLRVMNDTRHVLDNLDSVCEYKVNWNKYTKNNPRFGLPPHCDFI